MNEPKAPPAGSSDTLLLIATMVLILPVAIVVWLLTLITIRRHGIPRWWPAAGALATGGVLMYVGVPAAAVGASTAAIGTFQVTGWTVREVLAGMVAVLGRVAVSTALVAVPVGLMAAAATPTPQERPGSLSPALRRHAARRARREERRVERRANLALKATAKPLQSDKAIHPLGVLAGPGDLPPDWTSGKYLVLPQRVANLPRLVVGRPGQGKSVYLCREIFLAGLDHRQAVVVDCKGEPGFADEVEAAYRAGWKHQMMRPTSGNGPESASNDAPTVHRWPEVPLNGWTGGPAAVANRLLSVWTWDLASLWYREVVDMALTLALHAPGDPVTCSRDVLRRVQPDALTRLWDAHPDELGLVRSLKSKDKLDDVSIRLGNLLGALGGLLDGDRAIGAADLSILSLPTMGKEHQAASMLRVVMADLAHYVSTRKPVSMRLLIVVDEFSAVPGGREHAIHLAERGRSAAAAAVLAVQSARGLGDDDDADRLIGAAGSIALFGTAEPERILKLAGTVEIARVSVTLGQGLGQASTTTSEATEYRVDGNDVRALGPGYAYILASGRAQRIKVIRTPGGDGPLPSAAPPGDPDPGRVPARVVDGRELPPPVQPRQGQAPPGSPPASLDPSGRSSVRRYRPLSAGEVHPPTDHNPEEAP